jgi:hypothetical protein
MCLATRPLDARKTCICAGTSRTSAETSRWRGSGTLPKDRSSWPPSVARQFLMGTVCAQRGDRGQRLPSKSSLGRTTERQLAAQSELALATFATNARRRVFPQTPGNGATEPSPQNAQLRAARRVENRDPQRAGLAVSTTAGPMAVTRRRAVGAAPVVCRKMMRAHRLRALAHPQTRGAGASVTSWVGPCTVRVGVVWQLRSSSCV